jgi:hypothetical protein
MIFFNINTWSFHNPSISLTCLAQLPGSVVEKRNSRIKLDTIYFSGEVQWQ